MAEYIEREAVLSIVGKMPLDWEYGQAVTDIYDIIKNAPAADVVEVVRCKDCIHYELGGCLKIYSDGAASKYAWQIRKEDDFCSYGERRTKDDL